MNEVEYILEGDRVLPLLNVSGRIVLTNLRILFQPFSPIHSDPVEKYAIAKISHAVERLLQLRPVGVEVFFQLGTASLDPEPSVAQLVTALLTPSNQKSALLRPLLLSFKDPDARNTFLKELKRLIPSASQSVEDYRLEMTYKWARGELSTFAYLMIVNSWGDRTGSNLSAYPVFPWLFVDCPNINQLIQDCNAAELDDGPMVHDQDDAQWTMNGILRDLRKPVGAISSARLAILLERYHEMPDPKFIYGTHYSTPAYVLSYLVRQNPELMLHLQSGKFDAPDRLFSNLTKTYSNIVASLNQADVKELIPEFYIIPSTRHKLNQDPEVPYSNFSFLLNSRGISFGTCQTASQRIHHVGLPSWASAPSARIEEMDELRAQHVHTAFRSVLNSRYVGRRIHAWLDLMFGFKQRGPPSVEALNVFHPMCLYGGDIDLDALDVQERAGIEVQIREFGQIPKQVWTEPHPRRFDAFNVPKQMEVSGTLPLLTKKQSASLFRIPINDFCVWNDLIYAVASDGFCKIFSMRLAAQTRSFNISDQPLTAVEVLDDSIVLFASVQKLILFSLEFAKIIFTSEAIHDDMIVAICLLRAENKVVTGSWDGTVRCWSFKNDPEWQLYPEWSFENMTAPVSTIALDQPHVWVSFDNGKVVQLELSTGHQTVFMEEGCLYFMMHPDPVWSLSVDPETGLSAMSYGPRPKHYLSPTVSIYSLHSVETETFEEKRASQLFVMAFRGQVLTKARGDLNNQKGQVIRIPTLCDIRCCVIRGTWVFTGDTQGRIAVWDILLQRELASVVAHKGAVLGLKAVQDGLWSAGQDGTLCAWQINK